MTRTLLLAAILAACSPRYVQQPTTEPAPSPVAAEPAELEPAPGYWAAERAYRARNLCATVMRISAPVMQEAFTTGRSTADVAQDLCEQPGVADPFERLLATGLQTQLERAADEAERAIPTCAPTGAERTVQ